MLTPQFPHVCTQIIGRSVDDFYAAFPRDAADSSEPTVIARWHQGRWHFITRVPGFLYARMHTDSDNCLWVCTGDELICFAPDGGPKLTYPLREPTLVDGLARGTGDAWGVLHRPNWLIHINGNSQTETTLASRGDLTSLCSDRLGRFWAGGSSRSLLARIRSGPESPLLIGFDGKTKKNIAVPKSEGGINILLNHSNGELYVSIFKGPIFHANAKALWAKEAKALHRKGQRENSKILQWLAALPLGCGLIVFAPMFLLLLGWICHWLLGSDSPAPAPER